MSSFYNIICTVFVITTLFSMVFLLIRLYFSKKRKKEPVIGIFHPYSSGGGGGERVLWCIIRAIQEMKLPHQIVLYTGDPLPLQSLYSNVKETFNIELMEPDMNNNNTSTFIQIVPLKLRYLLEASRYPRFTLLFQSLASMLVGWEAVSTICPDIFIDSMGYAFTMPIAKLFGGCQVMCYIHYPTISSDMLKLVFEQRSTYNNEKGISDSQFKTNLKWIYYRFFAFLYGFCGSVFSDRVMTNSTWTNDHIKEIWFGKKTRILYPPVNVNRLLKLHLATHTYHSSTAINKSKKASELSNNPEITGEESNLRAPYIVSIGQFRPEKDHPLQLRIFSEFLKKLLQYKADEKVEDWKKNVKLILIGGCRDEEDEGRVKNLKLLMKQLNIPEDRIEFHLNAPISTVFLFLEKSLVGLHTMWNEHFGICLVEYQAAGLVTLGHKSGGPLKDIVVPLKNSTGQQITGYLASSIEEYVNILCEVFTKYYDGTMEERKEIFNVQEAGRIQSQRFTEESFDAGIQEEIWSIIGKNHSI